VLGLLAVLVAALAVNFTRDTPPVQAGVPAGTELTDSGKLVVRADGTVIDAMDVEGPIYVKANDVRITNSRITYGGNYLIRIYSGYTGTVIEDSDIVCPGSDKGSGIAFGRYRATRVRVTGCRRAFLVTGGDVEVSDSLWNNELINLSTPSNPTIGSAVTVPTSTTTVPPTTPPTTEATESGGRTEPTVAPPPTDIAVAKPPPEGMPSREAIINGAGPSNPGALRRSGSITVTDDGAVVENVDVSGTITIKANNVTVRNCRASGYSSVAVIRTYAGFSGTRVERCHVVALANGAGEGPTGVIQGGVRTYVGHTEIEGYADGIKAETDSLYEYNYIHTYKPSGSEKHLDGIQGSGDSHFTVRRNVVDQPVSRGGNSAIFVQSWNGSINIHTYGVVVQENWLRGGNYTVYLEGGKGDGAAGYLHDYTYVGNRFAADGIRYGYSRVANCHEVSATDNRFDGIGAAGEVAGTC